MRKFIVLHSAAEWDFNKPLVIYTDMISHIEVKVVEKNNEKTEGGTIIYMNNWCVNAQESMGDVLRKIKEQEQT